MSKEPRTLAEFLELRTVDDLKKLARLLGDIQLPTRKAEIVAAIVGELTGHVRDYWAQLDDLQQKAVAEALYAPWFDEMGFRSKYGSDPDWGETARWSFSYIEEPSLLSLFILSGSRYDPSDGQKVVPEDLKNLLKAFIAKPPPPEIQVESGRPEAVILVTYSFDPQKRERKETEQPLPLYHADTEQAAQGDLLSVLRLIDAGKVRVSEKTGRPTAGSISAIGEVLQGGDFYPEREKRNRWEVLPDPIKAYAWPVLLHTTNYARSRRGKLELTPAGRKALTDAPHETIRSIWQAWMVQNKVDELRRVNVIRGQTGRGKRGLTPPADRRKTIVRALKSCPVEKWFGFARFFNFMRASGHLLIVSEEPWELYIDSREYGSMHGRWALLSSRYVLAMLFEYAATLGLIDVAYIDPSDAPYDFDYEMEQEYVSRYDGLTYLQINALGAYCLGKKRTYTPSEIEPEQVLTVLPNFDVVAHKPLPPGDGIALEQFAEKTSDTVWAIRPERMLKALENGQLLDQMRRFLMHKSGVDLPHTVTVLFDDMADKASRLKAKGTAHLIEVKDAGTAELLAHDRDVGKHCFLAGDRHLVVPEKSLTAFRAALRKSGYVLPK